MAAVGSVAPARVVGHVHAWPMLYTGHAEHEKHQDKDTDDDAGPFHPARHPGWLVTRFGHDPIAPDEALGQR
jgi:hypothetical protein